MFQVTKRNTRTRCEICLKLTIKKTERRQWPGVLLLTFFTPGSKVSIVNFELVNVGWVCYGKALYVMHYYSYCGSY